MRIALLALALLVPSVTPSVARADHHHAVKIAGVWQVTATREGDERRITWTFSRQGSDYTGTSVDHESGEERAIDRISVAANKVQLEIDIEQNGDTGVIKVDMEEKESGTLVGKWSVNGSDGTEFMAGELKAVKEVQFAGTWDSTSTLPDGSSLESVLTLRGSNSELKGEFEGAAGTVEIRKVSVNDSGLVLEFEFEMNGNAIECRIESKTSGSDKITGQWLVLDADGATAAEGEWSAVRQAKSFAGTWDVVATVPDNADYTGVLELSMESGNYSGMSQATDQEKQALKTVTVDGSNVEFTLPIDQDGYTGIIKVVAEEIAVGKLKGEWILIGDDGTEYMRNAWIATRQQD